MWSRSELKTNAKAALKKYFWKALVAFIIVGAIAYGVSLILSVIMVLIGNSMGGEFETLQNVSGGSVDSYVSGELPEGLAAVMSIFGVLFTLFSIFFFEPVVVGLIRFFEKSRGLNTGFGEIFVPLKKFAHVGLTILWMGIKVSLWSMLFFIPGIIKAYEYSMVPYLLAENPDLSCKRAFQISKAMTKGNKWNLFVLDLSFILWYLLCVCTCYIACIWVIPYVEATNVEAYYKLKAGAVANGGMTINEVPDICVPAQPPVFPFGQAAATNAANAAAPVATESVVPNVSENTQVLVEAVSETAEANADAVEAPAENAGSEESPSAE